MDAAAERIARLTREGNGGPGIQAATAVLLRDSPSGPEALLLKRDASLAFVGGTWVFPGGRVDPGDAPDPLPHDPDEAELATARNAAAREAAEEAGLVVDPASLVPFSHWTPPAATTKRFLTWFFVARAPEGGVTVDDGEIRAHRWMTPADALARRAGGEIELSPPTLMTLHRLVGRPDVDAVLDRARAEVPERYHTRLDDRSGWLVAMWHGDAGYEVGDASRPGARHRLEMRPDGWVTLREV